MTFAHGGAGVLDTTSAHKVPTLAKQVDTFRKMIKDGTITELQLSRSVALVAISGNDYYASTGVTGLATANDVSSKIHAYLHFKQSILFVHPIIANFSCICCRSMLTSVR